MEWLTKDNKSKYIFRKGSSNCFIIINICDVCCYSLYVGLVRCFVTEFFRLWIEFLSCWLFAKVNSEMLSGLPIENLPSQSFKCDVDSFV